MAKKNISKPTATQSSDYQQSMREFREIIGRARDKISYRVEHPRFLRDNPANPSRRNKR